MKKLTALMLAFMACVCMCFALTACTDDDDSGYTPPPSEVIHPGGDTGNGDTQTPDDGSGTTDPSQNGIITNAVSVKIGLRDRTNYLIHMYNNAAANTMLNYLSSTEMRFPTYNYNGEAGFVAQSVRGSYTRNDEIRVTDIKKGELYLMSNGYLRLYFRDVEGANLTATPIGYFADSSNVETAVTTAYTENQGDYWGVDVYFLITKNTK